MNINESRPTFPNYSPNSAIASCENKHEAFIKEARNGRMISLGIFATVEEAEQALTDAALARNVG